MAPDRDDSLISIDSPRWQGPDARHGARYITIWWHLNVGQRQSWPTCSPSQCPLDVIWNRKDARNGSLHVATATFPSFATMNDYLTFWFRTALVVWVEWPFERVVVWNYLVHFFNATREVCGKSNVFAALLPLLANRGTRARALSWKYSPIPLYISNLQSYSYFDVATYLLIRRSLPSNFFFYTFTLYYHDVIYT